MLIMLNFREVSSMPAMRSFRFPNVTVHGVSLLAFPPAACGTA